MTVTESTAAAVVVDTTQSPYARLRPAPLGGVQIEDAFWAPRMRVNAAVTIPSQFRLLVETGRIDNLLRVAGVKDVPFRGRVFNDSDVYKWLEAASWALVTSPESAPALLEMIDEAIDAIEGAQHPDGYLNTYFSLEHADERWTDFDQHEMYCAGHLLQAAVAHHRATGSRRLLEVAIRLADHIDATFGPESTGKRMGTDGHPEVEMALVELARATGERRYIDLAQFLVDVRGHGMLGSAFDRFGSAYHQDHRPFRELNEIVGHAVRAVYLNAGATDLYLETGEPALRDALDRLWQSMTMRKMYVSGGVGSRYEGESFGEDYELPNALAYTETCAAIGSAMWNWRMLQSAGDARYADLLERTFYNAMLPGISLDGQTYFYQNPLADEGAHRRQAWFGTACCPPNVARTLATLPGYVYGVSDEGVWVHLYAAGEAVIPLGDGRSVVLKQRTRYPWDGEVVIEVDGEGEISLFLRIPGWCEESAALEVNGEAVSGMLKPGSYVEVRRGWQRGDVVRLNLPMTVRRIESHPFVEENRGRVALMRGPLLYCVEQADNPEVAIRAIALDEEALFEATYCPETLGGVVALRTTARHELPAPAWSEALYRTASDMSPSAASDSVAITAIPYFAWANREAGPMRVWLRLALTPQPPSPSALGEGGC
jgi:DUF1680 family protein